MTIDGWSVLEAGGRVGGGRQWVGQRCWRMEQENY